MKRRVFFGFGGLALGLVGALFGAEVVVRFARPPPQAQVIHPGRALSLRVVDGVPVWRTHDGAAERENLGCTDRPSVAVFGSSILYGSGLDAAEVFTSLIQAESPDLCVQNFAQVGFDMAAKVAVLREQLPGPRLVVWEVWASDVDAYTLVSDAAVRLGPFDHAPGHAPDPFGIPANDWLFVHLRSYEWLNLSFAGERRGGPNPWTVLGDGLLEARDLVAAAGAELLVVTCPVLNRPFAASAAEPTDFEEAVLPRAAAEGIRVVRLAEALVGEDVEALRADECCHYNAAGQRALARVLAPELRPRGLPLQPRPDPPLGTHEDARRTPGMVAAPAPE